MENLRMIEFISLEVVNSMINDSDLEQKAYLEQPNSKASNWKTHCLSVSASTGILLQAEFNQDAIDF